MPRWNPDAQARLAASALELFHQRGYDAVTINDIAEHAGLTRRSFFRHFPDKREVLFAGSQANVARIADFLRDYRPDATVREAVVETLIRVGEFLLRDPAAQAWRQKLIDGSSELQERERTKLAAMADALAEGLASRGVPEEAARGVSGAAASVFHAIYLDAIRQPGPESIASRLDSSLTAVTSLLSP